MKNLTIKEIKEKYHVSEEIVAINQKPLTFFSPYITKLLYKTNITPNQITLFWIILGTIGFILVGFGYYYLTFLGVIIYHAVQILDSVDGAIARIKNKKTFGGRYLDVIAQVLHRSLLLIMIGVGLYNSGNSVVYLYLGLVAGFVFIFDSVAKTTVNNLLLEKNKLDMLERRKIIKKGDKKEKFIKNMLFLIRPAEPFNLLFIFLILNLIFAVKVLLIFYAIFIPILFLKNFYKIYKKTGNLKQ